jgi:triacylglycerol esterase/lipase EstA (alpha/beta hydrolase family)
MRRSARTLARGIAAALAVPLLILGLQTPADAAAAPKVRIPLPVTYNGIPGFAQALIAPNSSPLGANDWSCTPSSSHPDPVVLVHATFADMADDFSSISPLLYDYGYCVYAFNYGGPAGSPVQAVDEISQGAQQLATFVDKVLGSTGAAKVDLVGHSQGGMMPRYYLKFLGGAAKVNRMVALAPSSHGTTLDGLTTLANDLGILGIANELINPLCAACVEQEVDSPFLTNLNAGGDTVPGVTYTVIETKYDEVVTPYETALLSGSNVTNILLQDQCILDFTDHIGIAFDPIALTDMLNALDPSHHVPVPCLPVPPII